MKSIDIMFISPVGNFVGGAEKSLTLLLEELVSFGKFKVGCVFLQDGNMRDQYKKMGIDTFLIDVDKDILEVTRNNCFFSPLFFLNKTLRVLPSIKQLQKIIINNNVKIIHTNGLKAHIFGSLAGRLTNTDVVWHVRDIIEKENAKLILKMAANIRLNKAICVSQSTANYLNINDRKKVVIYNAALEKRIKQIMESEDGSKLRVHYGIKNDDIVIGNISRIVRWKGQHIILDIFRKLVKENDNIKLLLVGSSDNEDNYLEQLTEYVCENNLAEKVIFTGFVEDPLPIYSIIDIFIHTPIEPDPLPRAVMEACCFGIPVIGSSLGGITEMISNNEDGYLVDINNYKQIENAFIDLIQQRELRQKMGENSRYNAITKFGIANHLNNILQVYYDILGIRGDKYEDSYSP